ncbi:MAG: hypothetical protein IJ578_09120 [Bacteroidales bacterium]|nr:hypothetical protein [Bacteroidales bacterium]
MKKGVLLLLCALVACEEVDLPEGGQEGAAVVPLEEVAQMLAVLPVGPGQVGEVRDAVSASIANGYDEEYRMTDLFRSPGSGVGDLETKAGPSRTYERPLKDLIREYAAAGTKAGMPVPDPEVLSRSDVQIYWPYSEASFPEGELPVVTFDPGDGSSANTGYRRRPDGSVEEIIVDEEYARRHPVWVVNRNEDSGYPTLELLRKLHPEWGSGGGGLSLVPAGPATKAGDAGVLRTLVLKSFTMKRQFDPWLGGASEFFVKLGALDDFYASTEAELLLYQPLITDFMVVVRRMLVGQPRPLNAMLVSNWTEQLSTCALMITEDDGGTRTTWKTEGEVKIKSKTYGFSLSIPFNSRDDIVWRGSLSGKYFERYSNVSGHFGDVDLTFEILER